MGQATYNGVSFSYLKTDEFAWEPQWTEDGADYLFTRVAFGVTFVLAPGLPTLLPGEAGSQWPRAVDRVRHALEQPRKRLTVTEGGATLIDVGDGGDQDVNNGPFPQVVAVTLASPGSYVLRFRCVAHVNQCAGNTDPPGYLSNRWTESVDISDDQRTTRVRSGKLVMRPGKGRQPDDFRGVVTPPIPADFLRTHAHYQVQANGLALAYSFADEEQYALPPAPGVKADGSFSVHGDRGIWSYAESTVSLTGAVNTKAGELVATAVAVALDRLERAGLHKDDKTQKPILSGSISQRLYKNEVAVTLRGMLAPPVAGLATTAKKLSDGVLTAGGLGGLGFGLAGAAVFGGAHIYRNFTRTDDVPGKPKPAGKPLPKIVEPAVFDPKPLFSQGALPPDPGLRSTAGLALAAAALNDPCLSRAVQEHELRQADPDTASGPAEPGRERRGTALTAAASAPGPAAAVELVDDVLAGIAGAARQFVPGGTYTHYEITSVVTEDRQRAELAEQSAAGLVRYVPLARPTKRMVTTWSAEREGEPPQPPAADLGDENAVLLKDEPSQVNLEFGPNGVPVWRQFGRLEHGFTDPDRAKVGAVVPPWCMSLMLLEQRAVVYNGPAVTGLDAELRGEPGQVGAGGAVGEFQSANPALKKFVDWVRRGGAQ